MPIEFAIASSHAPAMFEPVSMWPMIYDAIPSKMKQSQPPTVRDETPEVLTDYRRRIDEGFATLHQMLAASELDALIVLGDDQGDLFDDSNIPTFAIFKGATLWGREGTGYRPMKDRARFDLRCAPDLAEYLHEGLIGHGFDFAGMAEFRPLAGEEGQGVSHMIAQPVPVLLEGLDIPILPVFINEYFPPLPSAARCIALGRALGELLESRPERVALYASGGLSHDPVGPRAGWIDQPLDRWFLKQLADGSVDNLASLFAFDSDSLRAGTGEIRAWITVAAAMARPATIVDYIPVHHAKTGLAFAHWPAR